MTTKKTRELMINLLILLLTLSVCIVISYYVYNHIGNEKRPLEHKGTMTDYSLSFYNHMGQQVSGKSGTLKLVTDPFTLYNNYPNQESRSYLIDANGFRDGHINNSANHTAFLLGGSAAFGFGLDNSNKTFASIISQQKKYNIINSAVIGFLSGQELSQMVHYLDDFHPSLFIVFDGWNDIFSAAMYAKEWPMQYGPFGFNDNFFEIGKKLADHFFMQEKSQDSDLSRLKEIGTPLDETGYFEKVNQVYNSNVSKIHSFAKARGAKFLLVFQPELSSKKVKSQKEQTMLAEWNTKIQPQYLAKKIPEKYETLRMQGKVYCDKHDIPYLDINEIPEFNENSQTLFLDVVHPNEQGHEILAKIINNKLIKEY